MRRGFTLIELMIVVAIIGFLATTAVPIYHAYVNEASSTEARTNLSDIASKEEAVHAFGNAYIAAGSADYKKGSAYSRAVQPMEVGWQNLGYQGGDGGVFGGPVYFTYRVTLDANKGYIACAHRSLGDEAYYVMLTHDNRRAFVVDETGKNDAMAPECKDN